MYNVLICDDEKDIVNALEIYLSTEDINIFKAYNGEEAVNIVREHEIHLALLK
ncbi:MAG: response regulator [Lachnospiraceae bacterium]|nr:response regulator [Lachnospiraceae bacterium]